MHFLIKHNLPFSNITKGLENNEGFLKTMDLSEKFIEDFVKIWTKIMNADRQDQKKSTIQIEAPF